MSADERTLRVYRDKVGDYADMVAGDRVDPALQAFMAALPVGADVLDLGCGPGHAAAQMRDKGFRVVAMDASPEMAALARKAYDLEVAVASFADLDAVAAFDGVWASFSLLHAPKSDMPGHLATINRALRPGGLLSLGLKTGTGEARDRLGRFYAYYEDAEITALLKAAGFAVSGRMTGADKGLDGTVAPWIVLSARA